MELGEDAAGGVEVAPPYVDDLPSERSERAASAGVAMLGVGRRVPSPRLALDPDLAPWFGEVELGDQDPSLVTHGILVDESDPSSLEDALGQPLEPAARQQATITLVEQHQQRRRPRPSASLPPDRDLAQFVEVMTEAQRAINGPSCRSEPGRRSQQRQRCGHRQDAYRVDFCQIGCVGEPTREMGDRAGRGVRPPTLAAQDVDEVIAVESVEPMQSRRCRVGKHGITRCEHGLDRPLVPGARCRGRNQHSCGRTTDDPAPDEDVLDTPTDPRRPRLRRARHAVLRRHHLEQLVQHRPPVGRQPSGSGNPPNCLLQTAYRAV